MKVISGAVLLTFLGSAHVAADEALTDARHDVMTCVEAMVEAEDWNICLGMMFQVCSDHTVGTAEHVACLEVERDGWLLVLDEQYTHLSDVLTPTGLTELATIVGQWQSFIPNKCGQVAEKYEDTGAEAAMLGCEIAETVGVAAEMFACLERASTAPYCQLREN